MEKRKESMLRAQASRLLLFLLLFIGAGNSAWADEKLATMPGDTEGYSSTASTTTSSKYGLSGKDLYAIEKTSGSVVITVPENVQINTVKVIGVTDNNSGNAAISVNNSETQTLGLRKVDQVEVTQPYELTFAITSQPVNHEFAIANTGNQNALVYVEFYGTTDGGDPTPTTYQVTFSAAPVEGGTLTATVGGNPIVSGSQVDDQTTVTFTATPNPGYKFTSWGGTSSTTNPTDFKINGKNKAMTANFAALANPTISAQPVGATYDKDAAATALSVTAAAVEGGTLAYQWYRNTTNSTDGATSVSGETNSTFTPSTATAGTTYYYCVVTETVNKDDASKANGIQTVTSDIVAVTVNGGTDLKALRLTGDYCNKDATLQMTGAATSNIRMTLEDMSSNATPISDLATSDFEYSFSGDDVTEITNFVIDGSKKLYFTLRTKSSTGTANLNVRFKGNSTYNPISCTPITIYVVAPVTLNYSSADTEKGTVSAKTTGGQVALTASTDIQVPTGRSVTFTAVPADGYKLEGWYKGDSKVSDANPYSFNIIENTNLEARFDNIVALLPSDLKTTGNLKNNKNVWTPAVDGTIRITDYLSTSSTGAYSIICDPVDCATLEGNTLTAAATGTVTINQAADATYEAGSVDITITTGLSDADASTNAYTVTNNKKVNNGTTITRKNITMTYGQDGFWGVGASDSHGSYIASQTNPTVSGNIATAGTYYKFCANRAGTLAIDVKCNSSRNLYFATSDAQLTGKDDEGNTVGDGSRFSELYQGNLTFDIEANTDYYLYAKSTKLAVYGFTFSPNVVVTFNANGGSGSMDAQNVKNGVATNLKANAYTYSSKTFTGWNTASDGTGTAYNDGESVILNADVTLYAQWSETPQRGITLLSYTVSSNVANNTEYPADEGTVSFNLKAGSGDVKSYNGVATIEINNSYYIDAKLPDGYNYQEGDIITVTGFLPENEKKPGIKVGSTETTRDNSKVIQLSSNQSQGSAFTITYVVGSSDIIVDKNIARIYRNVNIAVSSVKVVRPSVLYTTSTGAIGVTLDPSSGNISVTDKVKVSVENADYIYAYWDNNAVADDDKFTEDTKHDLNPYYSTPEAIGNVYLHVKAVRHNDGTYNVATGNYTIKAKPVLAVDNLIISVQSGATAPKAILTYFNGKENVTVNNPSVTYTCASPTHIEDPRNGSTITGKTQGKVTCTAHFAGDNVLGLTAADDVDFLVSVNLHLYFLADFDLGKIKDAMDEKANGRVYKNGYVTADLNDTDIEFPTFTVKDRADATCTQGTDYTIAGPYFQDGSDKFVADLTKNPVEIKTGRPGSAMVYYTLTPSQAYKDKGYETTNIYIPIMIEETDPNKYVALENGQHYKPLQKFEVEGCTMTLGGWNGYYENGEALAPDANYKNESTDGNGNVSGVTYPYTKDGATTYPSDSWSTSSAIKSTISQKFIYAAAGTKNNNPRNETAVNPYTEHAGSGNYIRNDYPTGTADENNYGAYDLFGVPCRGAFVTFEPKVDGYVTLHVNQKTVLDDESIGKKNSKTGLTGIWGSFGNGRFFQIRDERGMFVDPITYCSNTNNINTPRFGNFIKSGDVYVSTQEATNIITKDYLEEYYGVTQNEYELNQVIKITKNNGSAVKAPNFITLYEGPVTYTFKAKAGKTYYAYVAVSKFDVAGFEFHEEADAPTAVTLDDATGYINSSAAVDGTVTNMASVTYDRTMNAGTWYPIVLPYSMNEKQVKYVFGNNEPTWENSAEIIYFDHVDATTIYFMNHFYKTIVAGVPCLVRPSKNVSSLSLARCEYPYVTIETPETMTINGDKDYQWVSSYDKQKIAIGDYYFAASNNGKEHNIRQKTSGAESDLRGFRAVLKLKSGASSRQRVLGVKSISFDDGGNAIEDDITGIDFVIIDDEGGINIGTNNNVYNMNGSIVRHGTTNTDNLPKGIYVVNGKKVMVK